MLLLLRFAAPLIISIGILAALLTPVTNHLVERWFRHDLELRARLIFNSVQDSLGALARADAGLAMEDLFDQIAEDERVMALAWCGPDDAPRRTGRAWPRTLGCPAGREAAAPLFRAEALPRGSVFMASFPLAERGEVLGRLVILHDLGFVANRSFDARLYLTGFLALVGAIAAAATMLTAHITLRGWIRDMLRTLKAPESPAAPGPDPRIAGVVDEIRQQLRDLDIARRTAVGIRVDWSPATLRRVLDSELPGVEMLVVSNREPYIHDRDSAEGIVLRRPASGLVTALEPVMRACQGTWIAHGGGSADRETVDRGDRVAVPPHDPAYTLRRVWLDDDEQEGYYYGLANEGLWPLCHITFVRPAFRAGDWNHYVAVNRKFADAVCREATRPDPIILVQDYHLALVPRMVRERLPQATIVTFWHIPWPNAEVFGICPWREEVLDGLLGSSIIGFHTQLHCNNFIEAADRFMECHIDRERATVAVGGRATQVRPYPISIAWPPVGMEAQPPVPECRAAVLARHGLAADTLLGVGVERFDFTKGIPDRFRAVELLLETHPEWIGRFVLLQIAAPTRSRLPAYQEAQREAAEVAERINARFGREGYLPIRLVVEHHEPERVHEIFRAADLCIVSSLHDGMNLVAKEFVAARDDDGGVLILSAFAGASRELMEALIVNPFDADATAQAIDAALRMPPARRAERMRVMRDLVSENNVYYWAGRMLLDASRIRKRERIETSLASAWKRGPRLA